MRRGFLYCLAITDWRTGEAMASQKPNISAAGFCVEALNEAINRFDFSEPMNTDQGRQFTSLDWTGRLRRMGVCLIVGCKAASFTTSLLKGLRDPCGTNAPACMHGKPVQERRQTSEPRPDSTKTNAALLPLAANHQPQSTGSGPKRLTLFIRCKQKLRKRPNIGEAPD